MEEQESSATAEVSQANDAQPQTELDDEERTWAMGAHLAAFAAFTSIPMANILGPLIVWMVKKDEMPFVDDQGKEALNFQISFTIYTFILIITIIGILLLPILGITWMVLTIVAAVKANEGEQYRYPLTFRLIK